MDKTIERHVNVNLHFVAPSPDKNRKPKRRRHRGRAALLSVISLFLSLVLVFCFMMYGPIPFFRELWINTAMETMTHQWLADLFFDKDTINSVMAKSVVALPYQSTHPDQVNASSKYPQDNATTLPTKPEDGEHIINGIGYIRLKGAYGNGWVIKVYDPSRLTMGISKNFGSSGEHVTDMMTRLGALAGINASGFVDVGGHGTGGTPDKLFIYNGEVKTPAQGGGSHNIIGIDSNNRLVLGNYTQSELSQRHFKYGIEFSPFIIMDGKPLNVAYYSYQPRTAIGQTKDGTFIFVVIDGRSVSSRGATMEEVQKIMLSNGAYNAANLDGGSSTVFSYNGKVMNDPCGPAGQRYLPDAFLIMPKQQ